jgi:hypothetical protein
MRILVKDRDQGCHAAQAVRPVSSSTTAPGWCTSSASPRNVTAERATQQARNLLMSLDDAGTASIRHLIRGNAGYSTEGFDTRSSPSISARVVPILPGAPRMNAIAKSWVGSSRRDATDRILIPGEGTFASSSPSTPTSTANSGLIDHSDNAALAENLIRAGQIGYWVTGRP